MTDERLAAVETALAHQERQITEMSEVIESQWKEIDRLKRHITKTEEKLEDFMHNAQNDAGLTPGEIAARDKPPHY